MKLLLTSGGISTRHIAAALLNLVGKPASETKVAFIPTAANVELYDKGWVVNQMVTLWRYGFAQLDIVDISATGVDWRARLAEADVIYVNGGNTFHLLDQARKTGFDTWLTEQGNDKVYVGSSAGSILVAPTIAAAGLEPGDENLPGLTDLTGINLVNFEIEPHCDQARFDMVQAYAEQSPYPVYALDDSSAIEVIDDVSRVISSGFWKIYP